MGFTSDELVELSDDVWALLQTIEDIRSSRSAGGKKITRREARSLLKSICRLAAQIAIDVVD